MKTSGGGVSGHYAGGGNGKAEGIRDEGVESKLARFAFVREERDREVRLLFRDVPPFEIASSFKAAGATLISVAGERVESAFQREMELHIAGADSQLDDETQQANAHTKAPRTDMPTGGQPGYITMMYFFDLDDIVYTVNIDIPSGIVGSVASIYPSARLAETEIHKRFGATFIGLG